MQIPLAFKTAATVAADLREKERQFRERLGYEQHKSDRWHSFFRFMRRDQRAAASVETVISTASSLHRELKDATDKLSWLAEAVKTGGEINAQDLSRINQTLKTATAAVKNLKP